MISTAGNERGTPGIDALLRAVFWSVAALLLIFPLVAMQVTDEVDWDGADFAFAGLLIGAAGLGFEVTMRKARSWSYRFAAGFAVLAAFLIVWANAAVGMIGNEDNAYNLCFLGVIGLALAGSVAVRFEAARMAIVMAVAALAHAGVALGGIGADPRGAGFSLGFALLWLASAALFRTAAKSAR